jgi:predicted transcriptional regulator
VFYVDKLSKWRVSRYSKNQKKNFYNGTYKDEETAAHASDSLARQLMENGKQNHILNFPYHETAEKLHKNKRKRIHDLDDSQTDETFEK